MQLNSMNQSAKGKCCFTRGYVKAGGFSLVTSCRNVIVCIWDYILPALVKTHCIICYALEEVLHWSNGREQTKKYFF